MSWFVELLSRVIGVTIRHKVLSGIVGGVILITGWLSPTIVAMALKLKIDRLSYKLLEYAGWPIVTALRVFARHQLHTP